MLEEKNDNLLEADGSVNDETQDVTIAENQEFFVENQEETETLAKVETDVSIEEDVVEEIKEKDIQGYGLMEKIWGKVKSGPIDGSTKKSPLKS